MLNGNEITSQGFIPIDPDKLSDYLFVSLIITGICSFVGFSLLIVAKTFPLIYIYVSMIGMYHILSSTLYLTIGHLVSFGLFVGIGIYTLANGGGYYSIFFVIFLVFWVFFIISIFRLIPFTAQLLKTTIAIAFDNGSVFL